MLGEIKVQATAAAVLVEKSTPKPAAKAKPEHGSSTPAKGEYTPLSCARIKRSVDKNRACANTGSERPLASVGSWILFHHIRARALVALIPSSRPLTRARTPTLCYHTDSQVPDSQPADEVDTENAPATRRTSEACVRWVLFDVVCFCVTAADTRLCISVECYKSSLLQRDARV